jgi:hypothetical protein
MMDKWICAERGFIGEASEFDQVADARGTDAWIVCPRCRAPNRVTTACDELGCTAEATCGFPVDGGYRRTCFRHSVFAERRGLLNVSGVSA